MATRKQNESIFIGSLSCSNQSAGSLISGLPKKVVAMTFTASPKKEPNIKPQNIVEMPQ